MSAHFSRALAIPSAILPFALLVGCGGSSSSGPANPTATPPIVGLSATTLTFAAATIGATAPTQAVTLTASGGSVSLLVSSVAISGTNASSFTQTNTCGTGISSGATCTVIVSFTPVGAGSLSATLTFTDTATTSPQTVALTGTGAAPATSYSVSIAPTSLTFPATSAGLTSAAQVLTITNTGSGVLSLNTVAVTGANSSFFTEQSSTCGTTLNPAATCTASIVFSPTASGSDSAVFTVNDNAANSPQTIAMTGTAIATATSANTVDCSVASNTCADTFTGAFSTANSQLASDPIAPAGFHGYADPSMRKDPNSNFIYYAYSWAHTLADGTHVVDLHLASSSNSGASFTYAGPLYQSSVSTQTTSTAYSSVNDSSTETVDLLPIPLAGSSAGQTLWVQAHQSYLVAPTGGIYDQLNATNLVSVTALQLATPTAAASPTALLALASAPEARLGGATTDPNRNITQSLPGLAAASAKCANWGQPALWYQTGTLYLALECTEATGNGNIDANELAHFLYSTTPAGTDASKWVWAYAGEFATGAQAAKLGALASENVVYQFFTEPEFVLSKSGQLLILLTPSVFAPVTSTQPVIQYGCRTVPVTLTPTSVALDIDASTGAPVVTAKITENDLYTSPNEGPAACTYEPAAINGVIIGRKFENDPTYGFYLYPVNTNIFP